MKYLLQKTGVLLVVLALILAGIPACTPKEAKETISVVSLAYGIDHYNKFRKTVIAVSEDLTLQYHIYPSETEDYEVNYEGAQWLGPAEPEVALTAELSATDWANLLESNSLAGLWEKSNEVGQDPEVCGTSVLIITVATRDQHKRVGGYVIDDQWLYETGQILDQLALNTGARAQGEKELQKIADRAEAMSPEE